jgi:hypothetical protein
MDVEGFELDALGGLDWNGRYRPQNVIIEYSDYGARFTGGGKESLLKFFRERGYSGSDVDGQPLGHGISPVEDNAWFRDTSL